MSLDWTGHTFAAPGGRTGRRGGSYLLNPEDRNLLRRYLLRTLPPETLSPGSAGQHEAIRAAIGQALQEGVLSVSLSADPATISRLYAETVGLGPLDALLNDPTVTSITANGPGLLMTERLDQRGLLFAPGFESEDGLLQAMDALAQRAGRTLTPAEPIVDLVWDNPDGAATRVHLNLLGRKAPFLALRRGRKQAVHLAHYVAQERMNGDMATFLAQAVQAGVSIVVAGMPGSGKTTMLEALLHLTDAGQGHVVLIEDDPEVNVHGLTHVSAFRVPRSRPGDEAPIGFLGLVLASLRMNCQNILVCGEVRGAEAGAIIAVMPSYRAVWLTVHGTTPHDGLERLVAAAQMGGTRPPSPFASGQQEPLVRRNLAAGLQVIVQMGRLADDRIGVRGIYWLESLQADGQAPVPPVPSGAGGSRGEGPVLSRGEGWDLRPIFEVRQQFEDGHLIVSWEANRDFGWPPEIAARLALTEVHGILSGVAFDAEISTAQAALDGNQPGEAIRRLKMLNRLASGDEQRQATLGLLHRALLAQPARWEELVADAHRTKQRIEALVARRDWSGAKQEIDAASEDPESAIALAQLDLEHVRRQIAAGVDALAAVARTRNQVLGFAEKGQHWEALNTLARLPLERLSNETAGQIVALQAEQLRALRAAVLRGEEDARRVAQTVTRLLPPSYADLQQWAGEQMSGQRQEAVSTQIGELLPVLAQAEVDDGDRHALYIQGCEAKNLGDYRRARELLVQVGDYRNARWLLENMGEGYSPPGEEDSPRRE